MQKFRKKPVEIEAMQLPLIPRKYPYDEAINCIPNWEEIENIFGKTVHTIGNNVDGKFECLCINIKTLEGTMSAQPGDWIIRGIKGELYPCKPDIFAATYDAVED